MMMPGNDPMTKKSRELYIGNLPDNVPEQQLMSFLNAALLQVPNPHPSLRAHTATGYGCTRCDVRIRHE